MENSVKEQFKELYALMSRSTFKDGPYEYGIKVVVGNIINDELIVGMNVHVHNFPDYVGSDLLVYALGRLVDTNSEVLKNPDVKWMLAKVTMDSLENIQDLSHSISPEEVTDFLTSFDEFSKMILGHKDKKIDLNKIKETLQSRITKLTKVLEHLKNTYKIDNEELKKFAPFDITYDVSSNIRVFQNNMVPGLKVLITFKPSNHRFHVLNYRDQADLKKDFLDTLFSISPIDFYKYDNISVTFK